MPKAKGEILGVVIVESGWGSMLPTIVIANLCPAGPAARCGHLNIGDQIIAINGVSLVGLPLSKCQEYIKVTSRTVICSASKSSIRRFVITEKAPTRAFSWLTLC